MLHYFVFQALGQVGNHLLRLDPDSATRLAPLDGKVVRIASTFPAVTLYLLFNDDKVDVVHTCDLVPDASVFGTASVFARLARTSAPDPASMRDLTIEGDVEVGRRVLALFAKLDIDWEEQLSRVVGDIAAHQAGNFARSFLAWSRNAADTLVRDAGEYLQHEIRIVPAQTQVETFLNDIDQLRDDVARLEQRVYRLKGERS